MSTELRTTQDDEQRQRLAAAHIPTYLKVKLLKLHAGQLDEDRSYLDLGYHVGHYHLEDFCEDQSLVSEADEAEVLAHPSRVLRRIFASEEHPRGDFVDLIPDTHRRDFLLGILAGAADDEPGEGWLAMAS
ncbi:MAG: hypothetical protein WAM04_09965 [Candidatus Sulfotelmatobacter sp.]